MCLVSVVQVRHILERHISGCEAERRIKHWVVYLLNQLRLCECSRFCRGCMIECADDRACLGNAYIAVDWDPTALHLRYQTSQERVKTHKYPVVTQFEKGSQS